MPALAYNNPAQSTPEASQSRAKHTSQVQVNQHQHSRALGPCIVLNLNELVRKRARVRKHILRLAFFAADFGCADVIFVPIDGD